MSFYVVKDNKFGAFDNYFTFAKDYGDVTYYWHGLDYDVNARLTNGLTLQVGATTGRGIRDTCDVQAKLPEATLAVGFGVGISQVDACAVEEKWLTNFRGLASYTIPKIDVLVSAIMRSVANTQPQTTQDSVATNGLSLNANYDVTSAQVLAAIGRPLPGGAATQTVNLVKPGEVYGPRINAVDMRFAKILRFGAHADQRRHRPLQPLQREHGHHVQPGLRDGRCRSICARSPSSTRGSCGSM